MSSPHQHPSPSHLTVSNTSLSPTRRYSSPIEGLPLEQRRRVLMAYDCSDSSDYAVEWVFRNLLVDSKDHLILLNVSDSSFHLVSSETFGLKSDDTIRSEFEAKTMKINTILDELANLCHARNISTQKFVLEGDPKKVILDVAERTRSVMIVLGARGLSFMQRAIFGSTSTYISQYAHIPVIVVKCDNKSSLRSGQHEAAKTEWRSIKELAVNLSDTQKTVYHDT